MSTVNYRPSATTDGATMWTPALADPLVWRRDMLTARAVGFDTLRVFVKALGWNATDDQGGFNIPTPLPSQLARLTQLGQAAAQQGIRLQLCLFDAYGAYGHIGDAKRWVPAIASAIDPAVLGSVELQNETPYASAAPYSGGVGTGDPTLAAGVTVGQTAVAWAQALIPQFRASFPGLPVVSSCTSSPGSHLAAGVRGGVTPDRWEWHCYSQSGNVLTDLRAAVSLTGRGLRIGEAGLPSSAAGGEQASADYLALVRACCAAVGLPDPAPWCLLDMPGLSSASEASYGLVGADYRLKAAARLYL